MMKVKTITKGLKEIIILFEKSLAQQWPDEEERTISNHVWGSPKTKGDKTSSLSVDKRMLPAIKLSATAAGPRVHTEGIQNGEKQDTDPGQLRYISKEKF